MRKKLSPRKFEGKVRLGDGWSEVATIQDDKGQDWILTCSESGRDAKLSFAVGLVEFKANYVLKWQGDEFVKTKDYYILEAHKPDLHHKARNAMIETQEERKKKAKKTFNAVGSVVDELGRKWIVSVGARRSGWRSYQLSLDANKAKGFVVGWNGERFGYSEEFRVVSMLMPGLVAEMKKVISEHFSPCNAKGKGL